MLLLAATVLAAAGGVLLLLMAAVTRGATRGWDEGVLRWMAGLNGPVLETLALEATGAAGKGAILVVVVLATLFLRERGDRPAAVLLWVALVGSAALNTAMKLGLDRPRPEVFPWRTPHADLSSFPSGHATRAIVVYGVLAFILSRTAQGRTTKVAIWGSAALLVAAVGASRVYLGVHYPSDVLAAFVAGGAWALACGMALKAARSGEAVEPRPADAHAGVAEGGGGGGAA